jgi:hypothetical protein
MRRVALVLVILVGCSDAAKSSRSSRPGAQKSSFVSTWRPDPEPDQKPPPPRVVTPPPPPDPVAEKRRAEAAQREEEDRQRREKAREFAHLTPVLQRHVVLVGDALKVKGLDHLTNADLMIVRRFPRQFPTVKPADLEQALAAFGDKKGAMEHIESLGVTNPDTVLRIRVAFGCATDVTCAEARAAAAEITKVGLAGLSDRARLTVSQNPELFPIRPTASQARH